MLYAIGGAAEGDTLASVARLNLDPDLAEGEAHAWEEMPPLSERRRGAAAAFVRGAAWGCGGHSGTRCLRSVESFDPRFGVWQTRAPLKEPRVGAAAVYLGDKLYVLGGHNGERALASV